METLLHPLMKEDLVRIGGVCDATPLSNEVFASFQVWFA